MFFLWETIPLFYCRFYCMFHCKFHCRFRWRYLLSDWYQQLFNFQSQAYFSGGPDYHLVPAENFCRPPEEREETHSLFFCHKFRQSLQWNVGPFSSTSLHLQWIQARGRPECPELKLCRNFHSQDRPHAIQQQFFCTPYGRLLYI